MKNLLHTILIMLPMLLVAQQNISYQAVAYDGNGFEIANQEISIRLGIVLETADAESSYSETHQITTNDFGLFSLLISQGNSTDDFSSLNWENGAFLKVEIDEDLDGEFTLMGINSFSSVPYSLFAENIPSSVSNEIDSLRNIVDLVSEYFGCKDHDACNYNSEATMSDNSCTYAQEGYYCSGECIDTDSDGVCDLDEVEGCTDDQACNYVIGATNEDGICEYNQQYYNCQGICENDDDGDGTCDELEQGCTDETADNYNPQALNSNSCIYSGCMDETAANYNPIANLDDNSCIPAEACPYPEYIEYDSTAASYNANLCLTYIINGCTNILALNFNPEANLDDNSCLHIYGCTNWMAENYNIDATSDDGSCVISGCTDTEAGNYNAYANTDDGSCLMAGCIFELADNYNPLAGINDGSCIIYGCTMENYPNFNVLANVDNGSCDLNSDKVYGCTDSTSFSYNQLAIINNGECKINHVGEIIEGGVVFYVDNTGEHGLIAALDNLPAYAWECFGQTMWSGASSSAIGAGLQNTIEIDDYFYDCNFAAHVCVEAYIGGYLDWYLPSKMELVEMCAVIGPLSEYGNTFLSASSYWSSTRSGGNAWLVNFNGCIPDISNQANPQIVRPIRAF